MFFKRKKNEFKEVAKQILKLLKNHKVNGYYIFDSTTEMLADNFIEDEKTLSAFIGAIGKTIDDAMYDIDRKDLDRYASYQDTSEYVKKAYSINTSVRANINSSEEGKLVIILEAETAGFDIKNVKEKEKVKVFNLVDNAIKEINKIYKVNDKKPKTKTKTKSKKNKSTK